MMNYEQLRLEKEARHANYYKHIEDIMKGVCPPNSAMRSCKYNNARTSSHKLVHPSSLKSAL
ncbi:hypothetical protein BegalDRAFT_1904 [Beggiatoa alba B18LD]|uniref:Uncharacterized protein n=1 Tax=Beggiatoa alba B18LD TaxID=395493 RepID=I3CGN3_9GAMM|nr:hypothetical protein BegalDRAFT_1904 [Beggiatoa alba B18LD]